MKNPFCLIAMFTLILTIGTGTAHAQAVGIDLAIQRVAEGISANIESGGSVAVLSMQSSSARMSDYLIGEMIVALMGLQSGRGFTTVNRAQFDQLMGGLHVNMAGPVSDATVQTAGRLLGVRYIVTGTFEPIATIFRLRAQVIEIETAAIRGIHTVSVANSGIARYLMDEPVPTVAATATAPPAPVHAMQVGQFTVGQRWGTWFLNGILPGVGSLAIMNDRFGGWFQIICAGLGFTFMIASNTALASNVYWGGFVIGRQRNTGVWTVGWLLFSTWQVYNIIRSATFGRNAPAVAAMPVPWNIALTPGKNGIKGVSLYHTRRF